MSGNTQPQFTRQGNFGSVLFGGAALTTSDGSGGTIGTNIFLALTADATNGTYVERVDIIPVASTAGATTSATVARAYLSSIGTGSTTTANTFLIGEVAIQASTADNSTAAVQPVCIPVGFRVPAGYFVLVSSHVVNAANASLRANVIGGDY